MDDPLAIVREAAARHGFEVVGVTSAEPLEDALAALRAWCEAGHEATMGYLSRDPPQRADPRTLQKEVKSVISVAVNYWHDAPPFEDDGRYGRVARYAWGRDYHDLVLPRLDALGAELVDRLPGAAKARSACDYSPFLERAAAVRSGLGFFGKNTCLLMPRKGSWFFLGELLLDVELPGTEPDGSDHCGTCTDCLGACPTDAFPAPFVLNANRCISYLTIEHRTAIPHELRESMGDWLFGCDVCQEVCPWNRKPARHHRSAGPRFESIDLRALFDLSEDEFRARFRRTPMWRPRRRGLLRNAAIVLGNQRKGESVDALSKGLNDVEAIVRGASAWALGRIKSPRAVEALKARQSNENDPAVLEEINAALKSRPES